MISTKVGGRAGLSYRQIMESAAVEVNLTDNKRDELDKMTAPPMIYPNWLYASPTSRS